MSNIKKSMSNNVDTVRIYKTNPPQNKKPANQHLERNLEMHAFVAVGYLYDPF